jgi:hypothetical protein
MDTDLAESGPDAADGGLVRLMGRMAPWVAPLFFLAAASGLPPTLSGPRLVGERTVRKTSKQSGGRRTQRARTAPNEAEGERDLLEQAKRNERASRKWARRSNGRRRALGSSAARRRVSSWQDDREVQTSET